jgi:CRP/FNR family cyclic AMP-dependent transcriptional regulator
MSESGVLYESEQSTGPTHRSWFWLIIAGSTRESSISNAMKLFKKDPVACLESHVIFHGLAPEDLEVMVPHLDFEIFGKGDTIIEESSEGHALYIVTSGLVEVVKTLPELPGRKSLALQLTQLRPGDCFGEMELLDTMKRSASVIAMKKTTCLVLTTGAFLKLYELRPEAYRIITLNLARELSRRLRTADNRIMEMDEELERHKFQLAELRQKAKKPEPFKMVW